MIGLPHDSTPFPSSTLLQYTMGRHNSDTSISLLGWGARCLHLRSEEHTSELQSLRHLVCRLLLEKNLEGTDTAQAQCGTLSLRLLKIGAQVRITARKTCISMAPAPPAAFFFAAAHHQLISPLPLRVSPLS